MINNLSFSAIVEAKASTNFFFQIDHETSIYGWWNETKTPRSSANKDHSN